MPTPPAFAADLLRHLRAVEKHYAQLFEHAPGLDSRAGNLVFTGAADDPETLETLRDMGFRDPALAAETVRGWHFGRRPAVQQPARPRGADRTGSGAARSLSPIRRRRFRPRRASTPRWRTCRRRSSFSRCSNPIRRCCELFADILGGAPRLAAGGRADARMCSTRPSTRASPPRRWTRRPCRAAGAVPRREPANIEDFLDAARRFRGGREFSDRPAAVRRADRAGSGGARLFGAGRAFVARLSRAGRDDFAAEHGAVAGGRCVVLGLGKLGSREMTATSDLDLVLLYDFDRRRRIGRQQAAARHAFITPG